MAMDMDHDQPQPQLPSVSGEAPRASLTPYLRAKELTKPATKREIAVALQRLRAVFGYEEEAWRVAGELYLEALADIPSDLLAEAVSAQIRIGDGRFPKPAELRTFISEKLIDRQIVLEREERREARAEHRSDWPKWLEDLWGKAPDGQAKRNEAIEAQKLRYAEAVAWRSQNHTAFAPLRKSEQSMQQIQDALGLSSRPSSAFVSSEVPDTVFGEPWREEAADDEA